MITVKRIQIAVIIFVAWQVWAMGSNITSNTADMVQARHCSMESYCGK